MGVRLTNPLFGHFDIDGEDLLFALDRAIRLHFTYVTNYLDRLEKKGKKLDLNNPSDEFKKAWGYKNYKNAPPRKNQDLRDINSYTIDQCQAEFEGTLAEKVAEKHFGLQIAYDYYTTTGAFAVHFCDDPTRKIEVKCIGKGHDRVFINLGVSENEFVHGVIPKRFNDVEFFLIFEIFKITKDHAVLFLHGYVLKETVFSMINGKFIHYRDINNYYTPNPTMSFPVGYCNPNLYDDILKGGAKK